MPTIPKEIIIVEGRDDTKRLIETFGSSIKTIETNGSAVSRSVIQHIQQVADEFGVIVFTDPDYQGHRIRQIIAQAVPKAKHAYLTQEEATSSKIGASLGIEHASPDAIIQALKNVSTPCDSDKMTDIPTSALVKLQLLGHPNAAENRKKVAEHFHLGNVNGKQLQKRLSTYGIHLQELQQFLQKGASSHE